MNHGLSPSTVARIQGVLAQFPEVEKALLYGSRAMGTHRPGSDIDLTLCGSDLGFSQLARIDEALDDLSLPYQMDLSAMASLTHPALLDHIRRVGFVFYEKSPLPRVPLPS
ncbi:MAG: nucleotidyltransferase domain-containing protein [Akkermansiaceae bacterium]